MKELFPANRSNSSTTNGISSSLAGSRTSQFSVPLVPPTRGRIRTHPPTMSYENLTNVGVTLPWAL